MCNLSNGQGACGKSAVREEEVVVEEEEEEERGGDSEQGGRERVY